MLRFTFVNAHTLTSWKSIVCVDAMMDNNMSPTSLTDISNAVNQQSDIFVQFFSSIGIHDWINAICFVVFMMWFGFGIFKILLNNELKNPD